MTTAVPRFSVLIPCYNAAPYIGATLRSIAKQGKDSVEVVVADGGSTDGTQAILESFPSLDIRVVSEPDRGQLDALQKAASRARGDIVYWLNADDILMPGSLTAVDAAFAADPSLDLVFSDNFAFNEEARTLHVGGLIAGLSVRDNALFYRQMYSECIFWRRKRTKMLPESEHDLRVYTDYAFFMNLRPGLNELWLPKRLGAFRVATHQASQRFRDRADEEYLRVRRAAWQRSGWSENDIWMHRAAHWPSFMLRQRLRPAAHAAARRIGRALDGGRRRRLMTTAFFDDWLSSDIMPTAELESILYR